MIRQATSKKRNADAWPTARGIVILVGPSLALLVLCAAIPPESAVAAVLLASATVPLCCCLCILTVSFGAGEEGKDEFNDFKFGKYVAYVRVGLKLAGILALMTGSANSSTRPVGILVDGSHCVACALRCRRVSWCRASHVQSERPGP